MAKYSVRRFQWSSAGQRGFSLISAVFVLVIMSLLIAAMLNLAQTDYQVTASETLAVRAEAASRSALEHGATQLLLNTEKVLDPGCSDIRFPAGSAQWQEANMRQCETLRLECVEKNIDAGGQYFHLSSTAQCGDETHLARRTLEFTIARGLGVAAAAPEPEPEPEPEANCPVGTAAKDGKIAGPVGAYCGCKDGGGISAKTEELCDNGDVASEDDGYWTGTAPDACKCDKKL